MTGLTLATAASVAVGLSIGAAATVGVTLAADDHALAPPSTAPTPSGPHLVQYGDRCDHGECVPCAGDQACMAKFPQALRP